MSDIKILVSCHKHFFVPNHALLFPIHTGAALSSVSFDGFLKDNSGDNISAKNHRYCELTAQYWAWKNLSADYYGFFHYRRYLYPDTKSKLVYRVEANPSDKILKKLNFDSMASLIDKYDIIAPVAEDMKVSVREHYKYAQYHFSSDLQLIEKIVLLQHPGMKSAMEKYLSGSKQYFGNIFIMKKQLFFEYCQWLFPILEEFERECDISGRNTQELRAPGYIAERLFGVFYTYRRETSRCLEIPKVCFEPSTMSLLEKRCLNSMFPPGSLRRYKLKKFIIK